MRPIVQGVAGSGKPCAVDVLENGGIHPSVFENCILPPRQRKRFHVFWYGIVVLNFHQCPFFKACCWIEGIEIALRKYLQGIEVLTNLMLNLFPVGHERRPQLTGLVFGDRHDQVFTQ